MQRLQTLSVNYLTDSWKIRKVNPHPMHHLCSRICSFPPVIPDYFLEKFTKPGDIVFDPWSGKGTVPFEALRKGRIGIGNDKSPEAYILTYAKVKPVNYKILGKHLLEIKTKMNKIKIKNDFDELDKKASIFYSNSTFEQVLKLKKIMESQNSKKAIFTKAIILGLLHGSSVNTFSLPCSHSYSMSPAYVLKYVKEHGLRRPKRDVIKCILTRAKFLLSEEMPKNQGMALKNDTTKIKMYANSVDMILTSPPYFNVQTYAWANWLRLWFLGYDYRKIRKTLMEKGSSQDYSEFMRKSLKELYRVLKPGGKCFLVVGDVKRKSRGKVRILNTAEFLRPLCEEANFTLEKIVRDTIPRQKKVNTYINPEDGIKIERFIYMKK